MYVCTHLVTSLPFNLSPPIAGLLARRRRRRRRLDHGHLHPDHLIVEVVDVLLQLGHFSGVPRLRLLQLGLFNEP